MTKLVLKREFNDNQAEQAVIAKMQAVMSVDDAKAMLAAAAEQGVMVPSVRDADGTGYDIFSLLLKERIIMVNGQVEPAMASVIQAQLLFLDSVTDKSDVKEIRMFINSPGGSVIDGAAIYDTMRAIKSHVRTVGLGMQASMGSILLAGGDSRSMTSSSLLMIHSIGSRTEGKLNEQEIDLERTRRLFDDMKAVYIRHIGLTKEFWDLCCAKDTWFTAEQALKMGYIDNVFLGANKPAKYSKSADAFLKATQDARDAQVPNDIHDIKHLLLGTSADDGKGERLRAELLVALSQKPEYWTEEKQREYAAEHNIRLGGAVTQREIAKVLSGHLEAKKAGNDNVLLVKTPKASGSN